MSTEQVLCDSFNEQSLKKNLCGNKAKANVAEKVIPFGNYFEVGNAMNYTSFSRILFFGKHNPFSNCSNADRKNTVAPNSPSFAKTFLSVSICENQLKNKVQSQNCKAIAINFMQNSQQQQQQELRQMHKRKVQ